MTFGERLKTIRKEKGFTQKSLGIACGLDEKSAESTIRKYEIGARKPREKALQKICEVLEIPTYELLIDVDQLRKDAKFFDNLPEGCRTEDMVTINDFLSLNDEGKDKVSEYIDDLIQSAKYRK